MLSNGRVFLINPAGILIGARAIIDTAGFVGSTLNMLHADFLVGRVVLKAHGELTIAGLDTVKYTNQNFEAKARAAMRSTP